MCHLQTFVSRSPKFWSFQISTFRNDFRESSQIFTRYRLLSCPNGQEPEILDAQPDLLDAALVKTMMQVATIMAHQDNQDAAKFLIHVARQLAKQLKLYPQLGTPGVHDGIDCN